MKQKPRKFNSVLKEQVLSVEMRSDKLGNLFYMFTYSCADLELYVFFESMTSVLDYIKSNF